MYLLPFETEVNGTQDIIALGNTLPQQEFFELHRIQLTTDTPVLVEILGCKGTVLGIDITGQVTTSNVAQTIYSGLFKVFSNPVFQNPFRLKTGQLTYEHGWVDVVDQRDGISISKGTYVVIRITGKAKITGNLLWMQPEGRRMV